MKLKKAVSWILSLMLIFTMIPALGAVAYAEDGGATAIAIGSGNIEKGNKVYMGIRHIYGTAAPISWIVLGGANSSTLKDSADAAVSSEDARLLITEKTQGDVEFNPDGQSNTWQGSNIQRWCTETFLSHFTGLEKGTMLSTSKSNDGYNEWGTSSLDNEQLFLLSAEEVSDEYGYFNGYFNGDESRIAYRHDEDETWDWWLRSPFRYNSYSAARVSPLGSVYYGDVDGAIGARPAFNFNLTSVLFTSAAAGGKTSGAAGADALRAISNNTTNEWKLTLKDASRSGFKASAATGATLETQEGYSGWIIPIVYSGATPGDNEYVSVILCDSNGTAKYYGNIANNSASSSEGGQPVNIPAGLTAGNYTMYVFNEQINGDKQTDYASAFRTIDLTVTAPPAETFTVIVNNGDGGGVYAEGESVTITANEPDSGKKFKEWTGVDGLTFTSGSASSSSATFTMPADDVTITAVYEDAPAPPEPIKVAIPSGKTLTYNGKTQIGVTTGIGYILSGTTSAAKAGSYKATAALKDGYIWSDGTTAAKTINWKINKAANPLKIGAKTAPVKYSKLKKKAQTLTVTKVIKFTKQLKDKKTYTLVSAKKGSKSFKKYFKINKTTGKVTIKKNSKMKKGTYKVKVKVRAAGNANYKASAVKTVTFKVKVK